MSHIVELCNKCNKGLKSPIYCSTCEAVQYCSEKCRRRDLASHKKVCSTDLYTIWRSVRQNIAFMFEDRASVFIHALLWHWRTMRRQMRCIVTRHIGITYVRLEPVIRRTGQGSCTISVYYKYYNSLNNTDTFYHMTAYLDRESCKTAFGQQSNTSFYGNITETTSVYMTFVDHMTPTYLTIDRDVFTI